MKTLSHTQHWHNINTLYTKKYHLSCVVIFFTHTLPNVWLWTVKHTYWHNPIYLTFVCYHDFTHAKQFTTLLLHYENMSGLTSIHIHITPTPCSQTCLLDIYWHTMPSWTITNYHVLHTTTHQLIIQHHYSLHHSPHHTYTLIHKHHTNYICGYDTTISITLAHHVLIHIHNMTYIQLNTHTHAHSWYYSHIHTHNHTTSYTPHMHNTAHIPTTFAIHDLFHNISTFFCLVHTLTHTHFHHMTYYTVYNNQSIHHMPHNIPWWTHQHCTHTYVYTHHIFNINQHLWLL